MFWQFGRTCEKYLIEKKKAEKENEKRNEEQQWYQEIISSRQKSFWDGLLQNIPETTDELSLLISLNHRHHFPSNQRSPTHLSEQADHGLSVVYWLNVGFDTVSFVLCCGLQHQSR